MIPLYKNPSKRELEYFNTHIKGSKVTKIPLEQYLKEKALELKKKDTV